jgi:tetratricopeptide (TPR) repeat protein
MGKQPKTALVTALEQFGRRREVCLATAKLETFPEVLTTLFGDDIQEDSDLLHQKAVEVEQALLEIISRLRDDTDRRIAQAVLAAHPDFHSKNTSDRIKVLVAEGISSDVYWTRRPALIREISADLQERVAPQSAVEVGPPLSEESLRKLGQLYRYAQDAAVKLEAFSASAFMVRSESPSSENASDAAGTAAGELDTGDEFTDKFLDLISQTDRPFADWALWCFAYCHKYLQELMRDRGARDYLRESLPTDWLVGGTISIPFATSEIDLIVETLSTAPNDGPLEFVDALCQSEQGKSLYGRWDALLHSADWHRRYSEQQSLQPTAPNRDSLLAAMVGLCRALQARLPDQTLSAQAAAHDYSTALLSIALTRARNSAMSTDGSSELRPTSLPDEEALTLGLRYLNADDSAVDWGPTTRSVVAQTSPMAESREAAALAALRTSLDNQALVLHARGDFDGAMSVFSQSERLCRELDDKVGLLQSLNNQGTVLCERGDLDGGIARFKEQEGICRELGDLRALRAALGNQALALKGLGEYDGAVELYEEMQRICRELGDSAELARCLGAHGEVLEASRDHDGALLLYRQMEQICREAGEPKLLRTSLGRQAVILHRPGDYERAMVLYEEVENICRELDDREVLSDTIGNRGAILCTLGNLEDAMSLFIEQERICREQDDPTGLSACLGNQAMVWDARGDTRRAMALYKEVERVCRMLADRAKLSTCLGNQGVILYALGNYDGAMVLNKEMERICRDLDDLAGLSDCLGNQGLILYARGDLGGALSLFSQQEHICRERNDAKGLSRCIGRAASVLETHGDYQGAMSLFTEMERICRESDDPEGLSACLSAQAQLLYARLGLPADALPLAEEAHRLASVSGTRDLTDESLRVLEATRSAVAKDAKDDPVADSEVERD